MVRHIVLLRCKPGLAEGEIQAVLDELCKIRDKLPGMLSITAGRSQSPEHIERGYMHGFVADFAGWDDLAAYQAHPEHKRASSKLLAIAEGGIDGILVFDLDCAGQ